MFSPSSMSLMGTGNYRCTSSQELQLFISLDHVFSPTRVQNGTRNEFMALQSMLGEIIQKDI